MKTLVFIEELMFSFLCFRMSEKPNVDFTLCFRRSEKPNVDFTSCFRRSDKPNVDFTLCFLRSERPNVYSTLCFRRREQPNVSFTLCFFRKWSIWRHLGRPCPERPNFSKTAGCQKPYKIICKMLPQTRFQGSPGTVLEVPGDSCDKRRQAILTRLSAKTTPEQAKRTRLSAKRSIGDLKHTTLLETISKSGHRERHQGRHNIGFQPDCQ